MKANVRRRTCPKSQHVLRALQLRAVFGRVASLGTRCKHLIARRLLVTFRTFEQLSSPWHAQAVHEIDGSRIARRWGLNDFDVFRDESWWYLRLPERQDKSTSELR